jgi:hypothetical protein
MNKEIRSAASRMLARATALGLTTKNGSDVVVDLMEELLAASHGYRNAHAYRAAVAKTAPPALDVAATGELNVTVEQGQDCWVSIGAFVVHPKLTDEGVVVDVYAKGATDDTIASTWAMQEDAEAALCDQAGVDSDDAEEWVHANSARPGYALPAERWALLEKYVANQAEGAGLTEPTTEYRNLLWNLGYEFIQHFATDNKWTWSAPTDDNEERFDEEMEAVAHAWRDACSQFSAACSMTLAEWEALTFDEQKRLIQGLRK